MNRTARYDDDFASEADEEPVLRILLAEDNRQMRKLLGLILRREGHEVVEARDGAEFLEALSTDLVDESAPRFDLIISEGYLPGIPGLAILAGLRAWDHTTPFVLMTGNSDIQRTARSYGAVILAHPISVTAIRNAVYGSLAPSHGRSLASSASLPA